MKSAIKNFIGVKDSAIVLWPARAGATILCGICLGSFWLENAIYWFLGIPVKNSIITIVSISSRIFYRRASVNQGHFKPRASDTPLTPGLQYVLKVYPNSYKPIVLYQPT
jgi:hypothetical protein